MENRHLPRHSHIYETDNEQIWNSHPSDSLLNSGNGSFMRPADITVHGLNSMTYPNSGPGTNVLPLPNHRPEVPSHVIDNTGTSYDPYKYPTTGTFSQLPSHHTQHNPCYNHVGVRDAGVAHNRQMDYDGSVHKRKTPAISDLERGNTSAYHSVASSSNHSSSAERLQAEDVLGPQYYPSDLLNAGSSYRSNNVPVPNEGFQRNVRSHLGNVHLGISSANHSSSNTSLDFQSGEYNSGHVVTEQWNHSSLVSHATSTSSDIRSLAYEVDHPHDMNSGHNDRVQVSGGYQSSFPHRSLTTLPTSSGGSTRRAMFGRGIYNQRTAYRTHPYYSSMGLAGNLEDPRLDGNENIVVPRYSRPLSIVGRSYERNVRVRNRSDRLSFSDESARARWVSEGVAMMDRSTYYDTRNLFDQHQDMRLDIDNMSYEELLALEDRIGYVSTGLSEDAMSRCLLEEIYSSSDHIPEGCKEDKCSICLESYKDGEYLGRLRCGHDFHGSCIKTWLLIKSICPICKGPALEDDSKGQ